MNWTEKFKEKVIEPEGLEKKCLELKALGKKIVTLNGSFDLMHAGHLHMIYEASKLGDVLIIGLNSDPSIKAYKSKDRPIIPLEYRLQMMTAIQFVDYVTWFHETDPRELLTLIKPDIHVNGSEYGENCIEAETVISNGGKIKIIPLIDGLSTSNIIKKIQQLKG